jgi:starvation-inducible outer membrane lipoprotein
VIASEVLRLRIWCLGRNLDSFSQIKIRGEIERKKKGMKKTAILMVVLFLSVCAFAQEKAKPETTKQSSPSSAPVYSAEYRMGGIIIDIDPATGKISIQQQKVKQERTVTLSLDKEGTERVSAFRKGDAVNVWVKGNTVTKIEKIPNPIWEEIRK